MSADVLVVGPAWVGDMVMAQSLFKGLKQRDPTHAIDVLAPAWSQPLLNRMPEVRHAIVLDVGHGALGLGVRWRLGRQLRGRYAQAIVLPNSFKSALVPFVAGIAVRTGFLGELRWGFISDIRPLNKKRLPRTVDRFLALGLPPHESTSSASGDAIPCPVPRLTVFHQQAVATLEKWGIVLADRPMLALCPGAEYGPAKRWPAESFAALANAMVQRGWLVLVCGSPKEVELGNQISRLAGKHCLNLAGKSSLEEVVDILSLATCVVSNDSGLMHVASALDRPVVALFGSSDPTHTPPLGNHTRILSLGLKCAPCFQRICPEQHFNCMNNMTVEQVLERI